MRSYKGFYILYGTTIGVIQGTKSLDCRADAVTCCKAAAAQAYICNLSVRVGAAVQQDPTTS